MYKHRRVFPPSLIWCLLVGSIFLLIQCAQTDFTLSTHELELKLDNRGKVSSLAVLGKQYQNLENIANSGFYVVEYPTEDRYEVTGGVKRRGNTISQRAEVDGGELRISAEYNSQYDGYLTVSGEVEDLSGRDRGIDLIYQLPVEATGWYWWEDITSKVRIESGEEYGTDIYPIGCVSSLEEEGGIGLGVAADYPCIYSIEYNPEQSVLLIRFKFGLTQDAKPKLKGRAPFKFLIFPVDPQWGFRDGMAKYYGIYSDIFERQATKDGLLLEETLKEERGANPNWNTDYFAYARTSENKNLNIAITPHTEFTERETLGIDNYQYVIPGQLEIRYLKKLPKDYNEAISVFKTYDGPLRALGIESEIKELKMEPFIERGSLRDIEGKYIIRIRESIWAGKSVTFPINPDPDLYNGTGKRTYSRVLLDLIECKLKVIPAYDGIFSDSFSGWGQYTNYRREHFRYADIPLTHDERGKVYISNTLSHREWLSALKERVKPYQGLVMGNGIRPGQQFNALLLDILQVETHDLVNFPWYRAMAYKKPFHVQWGRENASATFDSFLKNCTLYGLLPTRMAPNRLSYTITDEDLVNLYIPIIIRESSLGWEPVSYALSSDTEIQIERFGPTDGRIMFAIYNQSSSRKSFTLDIYTRDLGIDINKVKSLISGKKLEPENKIELTLDAGEIEVLLIGPSFSEKQD
jgi:hypothetical protein